jgi:hypothetical protein
MKRSMCGLVLLAAATGLWSCNGDPTESIREGEKLLTEPSSLFLDAGATEFVTVQLVDGQGNQLAADFSVQNVGTGITVVEDPTFIPTSDGSQLQTRSRFIVTGVAPVSTSFEVVSGGATASVPVRVTPTGATVTLSNPAPAANEPLVVTLPAGYKFGASPNVNVAGDPGIVLAAAADSTSITVLLPPGTTGPLTVDSVQVDFLPGVNLSLPTTETVTVGPAVPLPGTTSTATAPALAIPPPGGITAVFDAPDFTASVDHFYRLDVAEDGDYTVTTDWDIGSDIDQILCPNAACSGADGAAATGNHPESATYTLTAGTYYVWLNDFGADAGGATVSIVVTR